MDAILSENEKTLKSGKESIAKQYIHHSDRTLWDFDIVTDQTFYNINRIHPLKQRDTLNFINAASLDPHIQGLIVFGSAVRFDCHSGSDLDILVIRDDKQLTINSSLDNINSELDIIFASKIGPRLKEEIARTGVIVYER